MSQTVQERMTPQLSAFAITPRCVPIPISRRRHTVWTGTVAIWQHKYYPLLVLAGLAGFFLIGFLYKGVLGGVGCFLLAGVGCTFAVLNSTFCINSACHLWGQQPHGTSYSSRDSWLVSLLTFGEGYHNYHHMYPTDYRNGPRWYHFDPWKWLILGFYSLGLSTSLRTALYVEDFLARTN